jgi:hypothetical protein
MHFNIKNTLKNNRNYNPSMQIFNHQYKLATSRVKIRNEKKNKEITLSRVMMF